MVCAGKHLNKDGAWTFNSFSSCSLLLSLELSDTRSMSLAYEPSSELLHISAKQLFGVYRKRLTSRWSLGIQLCLIWRGGSAGNRTVDIRLWCVPKNTHIKMELRHSVLRGLVQSLDIQFCVIWRSILCDLAILDN